MQVYGILGLQLTLTAVVATIIMTVQGARDFLLATPGVWIGLLVLTLLSECKLKQLEASLLPAAWTMKL